MRADHPPGTTFSNVKISYGPFPKVMRAFHSAHWRSGSHRKTSANTIGVFTPRCRTSPWLYGANGKVNSLSVENGLSGCGQSKPTLQSEVDIGGGQPHDLPPVAALPAVVLVAEGDASFSNEIIRLFEIANRCVWRDR
ncbi:hypothetical protein V6765_00640 [Martelella sp. FOR1707]